MTRLGIEKYYEKYLHTLCLSKCLKVPPGIYSAIQTKTEKIIIFSTSFI